MNHLLTTIVVAALSFTAWSVNAEPVDDGPPAQTQKDKLPDTNKTGNYLETQPDNNGTKRASSNKDKTSKPTNIEKSKKVTEDPDEGGVDLKQ